MCINLTFIQQHEDFDFRTWNLLNIEPTDQIVAKINSTDLLHRGFASLVGNEWVSHSVSLIVKFLNVN